MSSRMIQIPETLKKKQKKLDLASRKISRKSLNCSALYGNFSTVFIFHFMRKSIQLTVLLKHIS